MKTWRLLISMEVCLWLLALVCIMMGTGSFALTGDYAAAINAMPLFQWLREVPAAVSWWLWITLALLGLLVLNTVCCSADTVAGRWGKADWQIISAPQLIHAGFLLIVSAHLISATGASVQQMVVSEGMLAGLPNGAKFGVAGIDVTMSPMGMPTGYAVYLAKDPGNPAVTFPITPNHPWFSGGYGVYVKEAEEFPYKRALLEIHHEPGAGMALAGSLLFSIGNVLLLLVRSKQRESDRLSY